MTRLQGREEILHTNTTPFNFQQLFREANPPALASLGMSVGPSHVR